MTVNAQFRKAPRPRCTTCPKMRAAPTPRTAYFSVEEVAALVGTHTSTVYAWVRDGRLPGPVGRWQKKAYWLKHEVVRGAAPERDETPPPPEPLQPALPLAASSERRERYALMAMLGYLAGPHGICSHEIVAQLAYAMADAMLREATA